MSLDKPLGTLVLGTKAAEELRAVYGDMVDARFDSLRDVPVVVSDHVPPDTVMAISAPLRGYLPPGTGMVCSTAPIYDWDDASAFNNYVPPRQPDPQRKTKVSIAPPGPRAINLDGLLGED